MIKKFGNNSSKKKLVLIHGGPGMDSSYFFPFLTPLGEHFEVITYDQTRGSNIKMTDLMTQLENIISSLSDSEVYLLGR